MYVLNEREVDYRSKNISLFKKTATHNLLFKFVSVPDINNVFFVISSDAKKGILYCIEIDALKPKVYNMAILNINQVFLINWKGPTEDISEYQTFIGINPDN